MGPFALRAKLQPAKDHKQQTRRANITPYSANINEDASHEIQATPAYGSQLRTLQKYNVKNVDGLFVILETAFLSCREVTRTSNPNYRNFSLKIQP
jgi:hypothetical protein